MRFIGKVKPGSPIEVTEGVNPPPDPPTLLDAAKETIMTDRDPFAHYLVVVLRPDQLDLIASRVVELLRKSDA